MITQEMETASRLDYIKLQPRLPCLIPITRTRTTKEFQPKVSRQLAQDWERKKDGITGNEYQLQQPGKASYRGVLLHEIMPAILEESKFISRWTGGGYSHELPVAGHAQYAINYANRRLSYGSEETGGPFLLEIPHSARMPQISKHDDTLYDIIPWVEIRDLSPECQRYIEKRLSLFSF